MAFVFLSISPAVFQGCATETSNFRIKNSLAPNQLAYYSDTFDKLREDLWEKAGLVFSFQQLQNIKIADLAIEDGKLRITTKTGGFSKGGLTTKYSFSGDFDIQIDCRIDFQAHTPDMDQILGCGLREQGKAPEETRFFAITLLRQAKSNKSLILSGYQQKKKFHSGYSHQIENFHGTMRFVRIAGKISTFYKMESKDTWEKMRTFPSTRNEVTFSVGLQNFVIEKKSITSDASITAWIDNFKINAAQKIIEEEI
jgi:hypothetical protein